MGDEVDDHSNKPFLFHPWVGIGLATSLIAAALEMIVWCYRVL